MNSFVLDNNTTKTQQDRDINQNFINTNVIDGTPMAFMGGFLDSPPPYSEFDNTDKFNDNSLGKEEMFDINNLSNSESSINLPQNEVFSNYISTLGADSSIPKTSNIVSSVARTSDIIPNLAAGSMISGIQSAITQNMNSARLIEAQQGRGPDGHAFDAVSHAEMQNNRSSLFSDVKSVEITAGSMFGPEGLAVGLGLAAATTAAQNLNVASVNENTTPSTSGFLTNAADN